MGLNGLILNNKSGEGCRLCLSSLIVSLLCYLGCFWPFRVIGWLAQFCTCWIEGKKARLEQTLDIKKLRALPEAFSSGFAFHWPEVYECGHPSLQLRLRM